MASSSISQLQLLQQNLQNIAAQKQQIESQIVELDSALSGLQKTDKAYKIVGRIMLAASKEQLSKEVAERKEVMEVRLKNFTAQEDKFKQNIEKMQKMVMEELKKSKK